MNKWLSLVLGLLCLVGLTGPAAAVIGTIDDVPAATLLLPYFEVDLDNSLGVQTLFSINNASVAAELAHVTIWSTWSIPVIDFDVYLTGFDVQSINLRNILVDGILPNTASVGQDPGDTISNHGPISQDINFASCTGTLPYRVPAVSEAFRAHLRALLTGRQSPVNGTCAGTNYGDNIARGYVTVDVSNSCSQLFPSDVGYFVNGGGGIAANDNVLWGDYFYVNPGENFAQGETLVHVEAAPGAGVNATTGNYGPLLTTPGEYTFYGRYVLGTAIDNREPLATTFATRYLSGGGFTGGTSLVVWRDSKFPPGATCAAGPNYGELFEQQIVVFDEFENPLTVTTGGPSGEPTPGAQCTFCDEAQRVQVGGEGIQTNADFGWLYLNLNHATTRDATLGPGYINIAQAWVTTVMDAEGRFSVGFDAIQLDNANTAISGGVVLPVNVAAGAAAN
ncbi:MAG TPA: hypothetical protein VKM72_27875 [Thermoanaerobaculia bacterium]|nr:hypothetical protein [Thermoanaerobaculia bacterium]